MQIWLIMIQYQYRNVLRHNNATDTIQRQNQIIAVFSVYYFEFHSPTCNIYLFTPHKPVCWNSPFLNITWTYIWNILWNKNGPAVFYSVVFGCGWCLSSFKFSHIWQTFQSIFGLPTLAAHLQAIYQPISTPAPLLWCVWYNQCHICCLAALPHAFYICTWKDGGVPEWNHITNYKFLELEIAVFSNYGGLDWNGVIVLSCATCRHLLILLYYCIKHSLPYILICFMQFFILPISYV